MAVHIYDEALTQKLQYWTQNVNCKIYSPSDTKKLLEVIADETDDAPIGLPIICIRRPFGYTIKNTSRQPLSYGARVASRTNEKVMTQNAVPIQLDYQIDVYTRYYQEADEFVRNLIFNIINFPQLNVVIPYLDQNMVHQSTLSLQDSVTDNSDIPERFIQGNFTRLTLGVNVNDAYLWDLRVKDTASIEEVSFDFGNEVADGKGIIIRDIVKEKN